MPDNKKKEDAKAAFLKLESLIEEFKWDFFHTKVLYIIDDIENRQKASTPHEELQNKKHTILEYEEIKKFKPF